MAIREIVRLGTESLLEASASVEIDDPSLPQLIQDLHDTMKAHDGVGISAPQIGVNKRVILFGFDSNPRYPGQAPIETTLLLNPGLQAASLLKTQDWEACLSMPGLRGMVPRYKKVRYWGWNIEGERIERTVEGFHARVVQHEIDHLDGKLFFMRITDFKQFGFEDILWEKITGESYQDYLAHQHSTNSD